MLEFPATARGLKLCFRVRNDPCTTLSCARTPDGRQRACNQPATRAAVPARLRSDPPMAPQCPPDSRRPTGPCAFRRRSGARRIVEAMARQFRSRGVWRAPANEAVDIDRMDHRSDRPSANRRARALGLAAKAWHPDAVTEHDFRTQCAQQTFHLHPTGGLKWFMSSP